MKRYFKLFVLVAFLTVIIFNSCNSDNYVDKFNLDKRYWTEKDYSNAISEIKYRTPEGKKYPNYLDLETMPIFLKLIDKENVNIVLNDEQLGLSHRNEFAEKMFKHYNDILNVYEELDMQDKFIYPNELVDIIDWGQNTQFMYFKLGNDKILKDAVDPKASDIQRLIKSNENIIVDNFKINIKFLTNESSFSQEALKKYADLINNNYPKLIKTFPNANYSGMLSLIKKMENKIESTEIKSALKNIQELIENKAKS